MSVQNHSVQFIGWLGAAACAFGLLGGAPAQAATANQVVDYDLGSGYHTSYTDVSAALGETSRLTGQDIFGGNALYLSNPYSNPWGPQDWVSIGRGGFITLSFETPAAALDHAPEINVLVFQQIGPGGQPMYDRQAIVSVSENGEDWVSLNEGRALHFDVPATGYVFDGPMPTNQWGDRGAIQAADLPLYPESDYSRPMDGVLDFSSLAAFEAGRAAAYGLSGGGNWLDISETGLAQVSYIRFDVPEDATAYFALDAVYLHHQSATGPTPISPVPTPATATLLAGGLLTLLTRRGTGTEKTV